MPNQNITKEYGADLKNEVMRRYEQLHPDIKEALISIDTASAVYEIGKKFGLNIEKTGYLADVIGYSIIGLLPIADFTYNLKDTLDVDNAKASEIAREVNTKIFLAIRERLKEAHGGGWDERAMQQPTNYDRQPTTPRAQPTIDNKQPTTTTPKSPWEIRPDGFDRTKQVTETKSVIPPAKTNNQQLITNNQPQTTKAAEAELKKAEPPEPPKTREAPQPMPSSRDSEVLKEIRPIGGHEQTRTADTNRREQPTTPQPKPETPKAAPPPSLPFMKEVEKLTQTPELEKGQPITNNQQLITPAQAPQPPQEKQTTNNQQPITSPKQPTTPTQKYATDPYREPIE
ncbi:MAG: hypothetical protein Q7R73_01475 [bacterium]|nr:hypothetical protein [bacterium]